MCLALLLSGPGATPFQLHVPSVYNVKKLVILRTYENNHFNIVTQNTFNASSTTGSVAAAFVTSLLSNFHYVKNIWRNKMLQVETFALVKLALYVAHFLLYFLETVTRVRFDTAGILVVKSCGLILTRITKYSKILEFYPDSRSLCKSDLNSQSGDFWVVMQCSLLVGY
jgi:ABC-type enterochelin transport system permease subunit